MIKLYYESTCLNDHDNDLLIFTVSFYPAYLFVKKRWSVVADKSSRERKKFPKKAIFKEKRVHGTVLSLFIAYNNYVGTSGWRSKRMGGNLAILEARSY